MLKEIGSRPHFPDGSGQTKAYMDSGIPTVGRRFKHPENWHVVPLVPDIRGHVRSNLLGVPIWKMAGFVAQNSNVFFAISILTPFAFHPYLGKIPILTNIFQVGWNHQPDKHDDLFFDVPPPKKTCPPRFFLNNWGLSLLRHGNRLSDGWKCLSRWGMEMVFLPAFSWFTTSICQACKCNLWFLHDSSIYINVSVHFVHQKLNGTLPTDP